MHCWIGALITPCTIKMLHSSAGTSSNKRPCFKNKTQTWTLNIFHSLLSCRLCNKYVCGNHISSPTYYSSICMSSKEIRIHPVRPPNDPSSIHTYINMILMRRCWRICCRLFVDVLFSSRLRPNMFVYLTWMCTKKYLYKSSFLFSYSPWSRYNTF